MKKVLFILTLILSLGLLSACDSSENIFSNVDSPQSIATEDEIHPSQSPDAVADSENVNFNPII